MIEIEERRRHVAVTGILDERRARELLRIRMVPGLALEQIELVRLRRDERERLGDRIRV